MLNIILFGPPGSGKGTQAQYLSERFNLVHISTGDLFRYEMGNNTELGQLAKSYIAKGELVPDEVTIAMLRRKVEAHPEAEGFIFDGFPRTSAQAFALDELLAETGQHIEALLALDVAEEEIVQRIRLRGENSGRADDKDEAVIRNRFQVYMAETRPVADYYQRKGRTHYINGMGDIEDIFGRLCAVIERGEQVYL